MPCVDLRHLNRTREIVVRRIIFPLKQLTAHTTAQMRLRVEEKLGVCNPLICRTREIIPGKLLKIRCVYEDAHANAEQLVTNRLFIAASCATGHRLLVVV